MEKNLPKTKNYSQLCKTPSVLTDGCAPVSPALMIKCFLFMYLDWLGP